MLKATETPSYATVLEFESGPALYSLITAAAKVETIHVCDRLEGSLQHDQQGQVAMDHNCRLSLSQEGYKRVIVTMFISPARFFDRLPSVY